EDELASLIAHELSHVAARHATEQMTTLQLSQLAILVTLSTVPALPPVAMEGTRLAYILGVMRYDRSMESEADQIGLELMESAGFDPRGMATMLKHLQDEQREEPVMLERLLSNHPLPDDRIQAVEAALPKEPEDRRSRGSSASFERTKVLFT